MNAKYNAQDGLSFQNFQKKRRPPGRGRLWFWTIAALLILGIACFWFSASPQERQALAKEAGDTLDGLLSGTPLAGLGSELGRSQDPPVPPEVLTPQTAAGTLSGRQVVGTIEAPMDFGPLTPPENRLPESADKSLAQQIQDKAMEAAANLGLTEPKQEVVFTRDVVPPVTEDATVTPGYLSAIAMWLANHYRNTGNGGTLTASVQALNQECGGKLASGVGRGRLLSYFFHPAMIDGLYKMYIDRFMRDLEMAAAKKGFDETGNRQFHTALAGRAALIASAVEAVLAVPDLSARLQSISSLAKKTVDENADLSAAVFALDELRQAKKTGGTLLAAAQMRVEGANARYRRASDEYARAQGKLAQELRKFAGPGLDDETLLFIAAWAGRRENASQEARSALRASADALRDFSTRCAAIGRTP